MSKKSVLLIISLIVSIILTATTVVFAWFTIVENTQPIIIYSGGLNVEAKLDYIESTSSEIEIESSYIFDEFVPNQIFDFKLTITNKGTLDGLVSIEFVFNNNITIELANNTIIEEAFIFTYGPLGNQITSFIGLGLESHPIMLSNQDSLIEKKNAPDINNPNGSYNSYILTFSIQVNKELEQSDLIQTSFFSIDTININLEQVGGV